MKNYYIFIELEISLLQSFLDNALKSVGKDILKSERENERGKYKSLEEYEHAIDAPIFKIYISSRAVAYELTAMVERTLHQFAHRAWKESKKYKGPKTIMDLSQTDERSLRKIKMISDEPFGKVIELIEEYYGFKLSEIKEWKDIKTLRDIVNSFKHRNGYKHPKDIDWTTIERRHPRDTYNHDEASFYIVQVRSFLRQFIDTVTRSMER